MRLVHLIYLSLILYYNLNSVNETGLVEPTYTVLRMKQAFLRLSFYFNKKQNMNYMRCVSKRLL